jgi:hypothetical protein
MVPVLYRQRLVESRMTPWRDPRNFVNYRQDHLNAIYMGAKFRISFIDDDQDVTGGAEIETLFENGEIIYLARDIEFDNADGEIIESEHIVEPDLRLKAIPDSLTDTIQWVEADSGEQTELTVLIGKAIEEHNL